MALYSGLARIEERLTSVISRLEEHMIDEHADFRETLKDIKDLRSTVIMLEKKVDEIYTSARVTRWIITVTAAAIAWLVALRTGLVGLFHGPGG